MISAATSDTPEMALVKAMSGVCNSCGTFEMTWKPRNAARVNT